jgi:hypothetical protein
MIFLIKKMFFYINNHSLDPDRVNPKPKHSLYLVNDSQRISIHMVTYVKQNEVIYAISYLTEDERSGYSTS